jgi:hypothetical protein
MIEADSGSSTHKARPSEASELPITSERPHLWMWKRPLGAARFGYFGAQIGTLNFPQSQNTGWVFHILLRLFLSRFCCRCWLIFSGHVQ